MSLLRAVKLAIAGVRRLPEVASLSLPLPDGPGAPGAWEPFEGPLEAIPKGRSALYRVYGDPGVTYGKGGKVEVSRAWERANLIVARDLPGYDRPLYVHRLVEPYLREGLRRACIATSWRPTKLGAFSPRHQRHDSKRPLSDHTWAVAFDLVCPGDDAPKRRNSMPEEWGAALESVGWVWGRRWSDSARDDMHFQLRRL